MTQFKRFKVVSGSHIRGEEVLKVGDTFISSEPMDQMHINKLVFVEEVCCQDPTQCKKCTKAPEDSGPNQVPGATAGDTALPPKGKK